MKMSLRWSRTILLAALLLPACDRSGPESGPAAAIAARPVTVHEVVSRPLWDEEDVVGTVEAAQRAVLSSKITGVIEEVNTAPGARVTRGTVLATTDAREIKARLDQAVATRDQAAKDFGRVEKLLQSGSSTRQEFDAATMRLRTTEGGLVEARTMLQYTEITAPFDGVVTRKLAEVGDLATPGKPLFEMENSSLLRFECEVPEALVDRITMGSVLRVSVDAAGSVHEGTVSEIAPSASAGSRTFLVKLDLPPGKKLRAGQFGRARVPVIERPAIMVPQDAVVRRGQVESVFVVDEGRARLRLVRTGRTIDGAVEILSGLSGGERVVTVEAALLTDGLMVEAQP